MSVDKCACGETMETQWVCEQCGARKPYGVVDEALVPSGLRISTAAVRAGDTVVIETPYGMTNGARDDWMRLLQRQVPSGVGVMVLVGGAKLTCVVRKEATNG